MLLFALQKVPDGILGPLDEAYKLENRVKDRFLDIGACKFPFKFIPVFKALLSCHSAGFDMFSVVAGPVYI